MQLSDILSDLHEDHRNMAILLNLLERETAHIQAGEKPDYELIQDIMRYLTTYSDAVHHPKEDVLYSALERQRPDQAEGLENVGDEHRQLAALGEALRNDIEAIASEAAVTRHQIVDDATRYIEHLRKHMNWEETDLFQRAAEMIEADESMFVDITHLNRLDPVFGPEREHAFANLLQTIRTIAESP